MAEALFRLTDTENNSWPAIDEMREEEIQEEGIDRKKQRKDAFCDVCFMHCLIALRKNVAFYLCYLCELYVCDKCFKGHESHKYMKLVSERSESDEQIESFLDEMRNESESEEKFEREEISMVDRVNVQHGVDKKKCYVTGLCGLNNTRWVVSDNNNSCIKIFSLGSNILQRYIRFRSAPWGVSELKREPTEQDVMSASEISVTYQAEQDKQCLLTVTLPDVRKIVFIDVLQHPAVITKTIDTEQECHSIGICEDKIVTVCREDPDDCWFVSMISTDGVTLKNINTGIYNDIYTGYGSVPHLAVCPGSFYMTNLEHIVLCMNDEGEVVSHKPIETFWLEGITVDPVTNNVYICAEHEDKVFRLDSSFESFKTLFDLKSVKLDWPRTLCLYRDRLYIGHAPLSAHENFVNVVRVL